MLREDNGAAVPAKTDPASVGSVEQTTSKNRLAILTCPGQEGTPNWRTGERFHHLFEEHMDQIGSNLARKKTAVEFADEMVSYADLEATANRVARFLQDQGVVPGQRVALLFDRSPYAYAALLAVSKVGAVFVPLDPGFPTDRIKFILNDSAVSTVVTLTSFSNVFNGIDVPLLTLDGSQDEIEKQSSKRLAQDDQAAPADALCYIIYTSGSTGQPKGVQINHSSICNFMRVAAQNYGYGPDDRVYQALTIAFDYSFEEIWVPLLSGSTLVPAPSGVNLVGADLAEFINARNLSVLVCVPTVLATIDQDLPSLKLIIVSGEACPHDVVERWWSPSRRLLNLYGPTEATVSATWTELHPDKDVTIGVPLPTYCVLIVDPDQPSLLEMGDVGEIVLAGIGLADGYLNRQEETRRAFIEDFANLQNNPSGRLYRTGDLGRINANGEVEYLGRIDTQIKIRGYRIELGEIETTIREVSGLTSIVVNPVEVEPGNIELVAYVARNEGNDPPEPRDLFDKLRDQLPPYMVPTYFELLDALPLLPSSKVDRKSLPVPSTARFTSSGKVFVAPDPGTETELAELLSSLLKLEHVSADADFFDDLGANSLNMARYLASVRKKLGIKKISMKLIYQHPTIRELAKALVPEEDATEKQTEQREVAPLVTALSGANDNALDVPSLAGAERPAESTPLLSTSPAAMANQPTIAVSAESLAPEDKTGSQREIGPEQQRVASTFEYALCAVLQVTFLGLMAFMFGYSFILAFKWIGASAGLLDIYLRSMASGTAIFVVTSLTLVLVKWVAVGRFKAGEIPLWSLSYVRFWIAQTAIRANPMILFTGTPLYNVFLRLLGAKIGQGTVILARPPTCTDLISVGEQTLIRQDCLFPGYTAQNGFIRVASISIGSNAFIGEATVLEINSTVGDNTQLGTTSSLHEGQVAEDGKIYQGSPAVESKIDFVRVPSLKIGLWRGRLYGLGQFFFRSLIGFPLPIMIGFLLLDFGFSVQGSSAGTAAASVGLLDLAGYSVALYFGLIISALLAVVTIPKLCNLFFVPDRAHPLFGFQYFLARTMTTSSHSTMLQALFGDSSLIVPYFKAVGYDLSDCTQNGSNFGVEQRHHSPFLCKFNRNTLVSDGLSMLNMDVSVSSFKMSAISVPPDAYLGNNIHFPVGARVGENCLIATKAMIPITGSDRDNVGILGSPPFEIPRSVARDGRFDHYKKPGIFEQRLKMKLKSNLITVALFMMRNCSAVFLLMLVSSWTYATFAEAIAGSPVLAAMVIVGLSLISSLLVVFYFIMFERATNVYRPMKPRICSLYERPFWDHERFWKLNINPLMVLFDGTPLKNLMIRFQGVKLGKQVFDNGASISEPHLVEIGDYTCLNHQASVQGHSLEDGTFKSDAIKIGARCTIGVQGFLHYGVTMGDDAWVKADAFVMKGSVIGAGEVWSGNPAGQSEGEMLRRVAG